MSKGKILRAIRANCLDCCCGSAAEVKLCPCKEKIISRADGQTLEPCYLYPYRFGRDPEKRARSDAQRAASAANLMKFAPKTSG